jgi:hypothetical protein
LRETGEGEQYGDYYEEEEEEEEEERALEVALTGELAWATWREASAGAAQLLVGALTHSCTGKGMHA